MASLLADLAYSLRALARGRFTAAALLILALGIGATTAVFSFVHAILLTPLPYHDPDRVALLWSTTARNPQMPVTWPELDAWRKGVASLDGVAALDIAEFTVTAPAPSAPSPERTIAARVTPELFPTLGVHPRLGRWMRHDEGADEVMVSHALWQRRFGGAADIVGHQMKLDDRLVTIVGVLPREFWFLTREFQIWTPLRPGTAQQADRAGRAFFAAARLRPGTTLERAQQELARVTARDQQAAGDPQPRAGVRAVIVGDELRQPARPMLLALSGAVLCLLLLACANLAHLLLTRSLERRREVAIRLALGASRARIVRLFLTESLILALAGGALGLLLASVGLPLFTRLLPVNLPMPVPGADLVRIDGAVLLFALVSTLATATLSGLWPMLFATRSSAHDALKASGSALDGGLRRRGRMLLVSAELACAVLLLIVGGLMARSLLQLDREPLGFDPTGVLTLNAPDVQEAGPLLARAALLRRMRARLAALPGVTQAAMADTLPLSGTPGRVPIAVVSENDRGSAVSPAEATALRRTASAGYFDAMSVPLRRGRLFTTEDGANDAPVALISEAMARRFWGAGDPIGRSFSAPGSATPIRVIGIVGDVRHWMGRAPAPTFYRPFDQAPTRSVTFVLRTAAGAADPLALAPAAQRALWEEAPLQPLRYVGTFAGDMSDQIWAPRLGARVLALFALLALLLAATGVFGVIAVLVSQRTRELGIRAALGASPRALVRMVMGESIGWIAAGVAVGAAGALLLAQSLRSVLHEVTPTDPWTFAIMTILMSGVAALACYLPARRASRIAPVEALSEHR